LALDGGEWSTLRPSRALPLGKEPLVPIGQEAGWAPEPVWMQRLEEKSSASVEDRTPLVQSVVSHTELPQLSEYACAPTFSWFKDIVLGDYLRFFCETNFWWYTFGVFVYKIKTKLAVCIVTLFWNLGDMSKKLGVHI
jgi:hypothetical protein